MEIYHQRIKQLRENTEVTLKEMGKIIGVSEATVQRYESGKIHDLPYNVITAYAKKFGVEPSYIMGWTDNAETVKITPTTIVRDLDYLKDYFIRVHESMKDKTADEEKLLETYRKLTSDAKKRVLRYAEMELKG